MANAIRQRDWLPLILLAGALSSCSQVAMTAEPDRAATEDLDALTRALARDGVARDFLRRAKAADQLADPLARCLAHPDVPGNQWPAGLAAAHCEEHFGPRVTAADVQQALDGNTLVALEARYAADLARHFTDAAFSEAIHADFEAFDGTTRSDMLSRTWLQRAPDSPYALAARGNHFRRAENALRAGRFPGSIDEAESARIDELATQAIDHFEQALTREPRLIEALVGIVNASRTAKATEAAEVAARRAEALDPGCVELAEQVMIGLTPQWGGSIAAMQAYAGKLAKHQARRPLLALHMVSPIIRDAAGIDGDYAAQARLSAQAVRAAPETRALAMLSQARKKTSSAHPLEALVYAVAESRWVPAANPIYRGELLLSRLEDADWARTTLEAAVRQDTSDGVGHYHLAVAYKALAREKDAMGEIVFAMANEETRGAAMRKLSEWVTTAAGPDFDTRGATGPAEAIREATEAAPLGVPGIYAFEVVASGTIRGYVYLNSFTDYRDPRNVTIAISPDAAEALRKQHGPDLEAALRGKRVVVTGVVRRVPIFVGGPPKPAVPAYHQTHVVVDDAAQLRVAPAPAL